MESSSMPTDHEKNISNNGEAIDDTLADPVDLNTEEQTNESRKQTVNQPEESLNRISPMMFDDDTQNSVVTETQPLSPKRKKVELYAKDVGPFFYDVKGNVVTPPIITKNLPEVFEYLPIFGKPESPLDLNEFYRGKIRDFVGCDLNDEEFSDLEKYCSPENLKTGKELVMTTKVPQPGLLTNKFDSQSDGTTDNQVAPNLYILKKCKLRMERDVKGHFTKKLKYRGVRIIPHIPEEDDDVTIPELSAPSPADQELEPGRDILYRVRVYRPYTYTPTKERHTRIRHSVFCCDMVVCGRQPLSALRDRFVCHNDFDMRIDVADNPDVLPNTKAKDVFPSGFLFINNVFYVDSRSGCGDCSAPVRAWAARRGLGRFRKRDLCRVTLHQLVIKLGHPDVYVHQGNCEHVFIFSEVRLLNPSDPLLLSQYPYSSAVGQNQSMYCTTCAEFCAKWIVVGCNRVPFDPAFFCESCLKQYLYKDGQKIGDFKAYSYRGNALNLLKPQ